MSQGQQKTFLGFFRKHYQCEVLGKLSYGIYFDFCIGGFLGNKILEFLHSLVPSLDAIRKNDVIVAAEKELLCLWLIMYEAVAMRNSRVIYDRKNSSFYSLKRNMVSCLVSLMRLMVWWVI